MALGRLLGVPESEMGFIRRRHSSDDECLQSVIQYWLLRSPSITWRYLIWALDGMFKSEVADPIRSWAEPVRGMLHSVNENYAMPMRM